MKLLTVVTALAALGVDGFFETRFEFDSQSGDLVVRAGGDPLYLEGSDGGLDPWLDQLAGQLKGSGVLAVPGALVLDEGAFAAPGPGPGWPSSDQHWTEWCALSAGFSANAGCITATVTPGVVGSPASVQVRPRDHGLVRRGSVTTGARGSRNAVAVGANASGLTVRGSLPSGTSPFVSRFAHPNPVELFGTALVKGLGRRGVSVAGGFRRERGAPGGVGVARLRSPLVGMLVPILRDSRNSIADQLLYAFACQMGFHGDRPGGQRAIHSVLLDLGVDSSGMVVVDGSGLSRDGRVRPEQFTAVLSAARPLPCWDYILDALPRSGETGSLSGRMREAPVRGRVRAKTGFIGGTSSLVGVAHNLEGRELAFALVVNYPVVSGLNTSCWKPLGDQVALALVESEEQQ